MSSQMVKGNTAVIVGALYAGCDCYFGYPITPASEVLHEASKYFPKAGRTFIQAESEEAKKILHDRSTHLYHVEEFDAGLL